MEKAKKAFVSCELVDGKSKTEAMGNLDDVMSLTVYLLGAVASSITNAGITDFDDSRKIIMAICFTAIESLDEIGGK